MRNMHILNGDSAANSFRQAFHLQRGEVLICRDILSCGFLDTFVDLEPWRSQRLGHWDEMCKQHGFQPPEWQDPALRDLYQCMYELEHAETINIWVGRALSDQLLLAFIVYLFKFYNWDTSKLSVYQYHQAEKLTVLGLGLLNSEEIIRLKPQPFSLGVKEIDFCIEAWNAITQPAPEQLMALLVEETTCLPNLKRALRNYLYRYPSIDNGLSYIDSVILRHTQNHAPNTQRIIGYTLAHDMNPQNTKNIHELDTVGDLYLFSRLKKMANNSLNNPLLTAHPLDKSLRETRSEITEFGKSVLNGKHNVVTFNGINDVIGGVELIAGPGEQTWYRDGERLIFGEGRI